MNLSYSVRLVFLSLASFFFVIAAAGALVSILSNRIIAFASKLQASAAARLLFAACLLPSFLAMLTVAGLCVPSYLWLEPENSGEKIGIVCAAAAIAGAAITMRAIFRGARAVAEVRHFLRTCHQSGSELRIAEESALLIDGSRIAATAGVLKTHVIVSQDVVATLSDAQLEMAMRHERSHSSSRDNLKRLAILFAPRVFSLQKIESAWRRAAEWAADDAAVAGDESRALDLAEALIRVARLGSVAPVALSTSLAAEDLSARIDRLLNRPEPSKPPRWRFAASAVLVSAIVLLRPSTLDFVHRALEKLVR